MQMDEKGITEFKYFISSCIVTFICYISLTNSLIIDKQVLSIIVDRRLSHHRPTTLVSHTYRSSSRIIETHHLLRLTI